MGTSVMRSVVDNVLLRKRGRESLVLYVQVKKKVGRPDFLRPPTAVANAYMKEWPLLATLPGLGSRRQFCKKRGTREMWVEPLWAKNIMAFFFAKHGPAFSHDLICSPVTMDEVGRHTKASQGHAEGGHRRFSRGQRRASPLTEALIPLPVAKREKGG